MRILPRQHPRSKPWQYLKRPTRKPEHEQGEDAHEKLGGTYGYIYFPDEWREQFIDFPTIKISAINEDPCVIPAVLGAIEWEPGGEYGEFDTRCMAKFSRAEVQELLEPGTYIFKVEGELLDGTPFEGLSDEITVINPP